MAFLFRRARESRPENQVAATEPGDDRRDLLENVSEGPEGVPSYGSMPRHIPDESNDDASRGKDYGVERPRNRPRAGFCVRMRCGPARDRSSHEAFKLRGVGMNLWRATP